MILEYDMSLSDSNSRHLQSQYNGIEEYNNIISPLTHEILAINETALWTKSTIIRNKLDMSIKMISYIID